MAGEYIQSDSLKSYWKQLKAFYTAGSPLFQKITKKQYDSYQKSEREDSDNHLNQERLGQDTQVVDVAFYKYLPDHQTAYRIHIVDVAGETEEHFFITRSF